MASSRKSKSDDLLERVKSALQPVIPEGSSILAGLSGGVDSVVLLHALHALAPACGWRLQALHVHHGISPRADEWAKFCAELCARLNVPFQVEHVDIKPLRERGVEAAARELRHAVLNRRQVDFVALAHHLDDQAETMLLQLLRGAGVKGACAMPFIRRKEGVPAQLRPLLDVPRRALVEYAKEHALAWVEDESNADDAYPRNFLRHRVLPILEERFPAYRETLGRSSRHFAEASGLMDELAELDGAGAIQGGGVQVARLKTLNHARAKNLLRYFLHSFGVSMPQEAQLDDMLNQLCHARNDAGVCLDFDGWQMRRFQGRAYVTHLKPLQDRFGVTWNGEEVLDLPELGGKLYFDRTSGAGISLTQLQQAKVTVRPRTGAERLKPSGKRPTRTLRNLLQEMNMPPWRRERLPLLFCDETLAAVPDVGVACAYQAGPNEAGVTLRWETQ
jgi:tRNA(Ile)-lysidine synthase